MTDKNVNYTPELTASIVDAYKAGETVEAIAEKVGKSVRSVVAKLSREGAYVAKATAAKAAHETKADVVAKIAGIIGVDVEVVASLEKATGPALAAVFAALKD